MNNCSGRRCGVFRTFSCSPANVSLVSSAFISLGSIYSIKSALSYMLSRLLYSFANYRTTDFMALGKFASILGALVKHIPFIIALCTICNGIICITGIIYILLGLCGNSYSPAGQIIVDNCRLYFSNCERPTVGSLLDCNDPSQLISSPFLQLRCLPGSSEICKYSQELQSGTNPCTREMLRSYLESSGDQEVIEELQKQESRALLMEQFKQKETLTVSNQAKVQRKLSSTYISTLQGVSNRELLNLYLIPTSPSNQSELISSYGFSDLYTAARVWIAVACYTYVSTTILFFFVKYFSPQDSCFSFVRKPDEFFLLKILNVFTPWQ
ncbi:putative signal peptide-containing and transmembrane domain-containing protein [Cryptosporidium canis]|uniref:Signal peptide-containing and transmembrane domain-containing protein n=1 Tax=Cryptosporidium canis TaxID=195482 RepID=A0A9D5HVL8_9CRYT|nr:putative signal peptide-containing and transmembrane domain-containing protein [Cryptosporidium canis]